MIYNTDQANWFSKSLANHLAPLIGGQEAMAWLNIIVAILTVATSAIAFYRGRINIRRISYDDPYMLSNLRREAFRNPTSSVAAGFLLLSIGLAIADIPGLLIPALGLFITFVAVSLVIQSLSLLGFYSSVQSHPESEYVPNLERKEGHYLLQARSKSIDAIIKPFSYIEVDRLNNLENEYASKTLTEFIKRVRHFRLIDALILMLDLIDNNDINEANAVAEILYDTPICSSTAYWVLCAVIHADDNRAIELDLREAYRLSSEPPDWLTRLAICGRERGPVESWYTSDIRAHLLEAMLSATM